ncbi:MULTISPECIES: cytochrome c family protein [unclassified Aliihoeflea]|uniref:c-type cytochrome n=1 Tax=unclassified Aliihoeflea TaxID=2628764 RepID=UPI000465045E|nr:MULTISPECIES: cytochrome c family protein [unclassified Aliihoeflea]MCO6388903.1 c-type cytochrome [Aliihoeflea sp. 40Bstr573]
MKYLIKFFAPAIFAAGIGQATAQDVEAGKKLFARCVACHNIDTTANKMGPHLQGILDRPAASVESFKYSPAMTEAADAGLVWDEASLREYLADPKKKVPGTRMVFPGLKKDDELSNIIAYLESVPATE